jgi:MFS family permease
VFAMTAALCLTATLAVAPIVRRVSPPAAGTALSKPLNRMAAGVVDAARDPNMRVLLILLGAQFVAIGALDVLAVVLAIEVLDLGGSGAGWLTAAFGAGGVLGIAATAPLVGRTRLMPALLAGVVAWGFAFILLGLAAAPASALLLLAVAGTSRAVVDVAGRTILQRVAPPDALARVFGVLEALTMLGLAMGAILVPPLISLGGARAAIMGVGSILPVLAALTGRRLLGIDPHATVPVVEIALLRSNEVFSSLPPPALVAVARELQPLDVADGTVVMRQGERGDHYYVIADGQLDVRQDGALVAVRRRGEGLGEIALLRRVARTATVVARTDARLYALEGGPFIAAVTGHAASARAADRVIGERLP